jgi:hypothetical protein
LHSKDLWKRAVDALSDDVKSQIDWTQDQKRVPLGNLLQLTEDAQKQAADKAWSFKRPNGDKVNVRDVLTKVAKWLNHFKDVGDLAVQYDPAHAALPWAGFRLLLNVSCHSLHGACHTDPG